MVYKIIRDGNLNEETAPDLSRELLAAVVTSLPELLDQPNYSFTKKNFPIKAKTIKYWVLFQQYWRVLRRELIDEKVISGEIEVDWKGSSASYSVPPLSLDEREKIRRKCDQLIKENAPINGRTIPDDDIAERLKKAVSALNNDDEIVMGPLFPDAQNLFERGVDADMEIELAQEYLCHFIKKFLDNYQSLIEHNFPTLKQYFPLYATMPVHVKTIIRKEKNESLLQSSVTLVFLMPEDKSGKDINLSEPAESEFTASEIRDWWPEGGLNFNGRKYRTWSVSSGDIKRFYQTYPRYPDIGQSPRDTPLRDFTYDWIFGELPEVFPELGKMYNTELNPSSF